MTSFLKLSHYFLRDVFLADINTQIIQKTISKHHPLCECRETSTVELLQISLQTVFILILMFCFEFKSLNCNRNGHHYTFFSVDAAFYNNFVTM